MDRLQIDYDHIRKLRRLGVTNLQQAKDTIEEAKQAHKDGKMDEFLSTKAGLCQRAVVNAFAYQHMNRQVAEQLAKSVCPMGADTVIG